MTRDADPGQPSAADPWRRRTAYFAAANLLALAIAGGLVIVLASIPEGRGLDPLLARLGRLLAAHRWLAAFLAATPLLAALLVGQQEIRRALARRRRSSR